MKKGVSETVSFVVLVALAFAVAAFVSPWVFTLVTNSSNQTEQTVLNKLICGNAAYDFDTDYGTFGVNWNFTGSGDWLRAKIMNTGTVNLYSFSFEIELNDSTIVSYDVNQTAQKTEANPLKPGQSALLQAAITDNINMTLVKVKVRNGVCQNVFVSQEV
jgi:FlaG/FlaF family flagellin (archaellin)